MMEIAADWLKVNPDPGSGFINIPGLEKDKEKRTAVIREQQITRLKRKARDPLLPAELKKQLIPLMDEVDSKLSEIIEVSDDLIAKETEAQELLNEVPTPGQSKNGVESHLHVDLGRWCLAWARHGHNVFDLSPDFTAAMLLTDPTEVDIKTARLPFRGLLITIPAEFATGSEGLHYTKIHVWEMPRTHIEQLDVGHQIVDAMKGLSADSKRNILTNVEKSLVDQPPRRLIPVIDESDTAICIYATDGAHAFETLIESKNLSWANIDALPDNVTDETDRYARLTIQQIVFGMLAYVNAVGGAVTERPAPEKSKKKKRKGGESSKLKHWEVGRTIRLDQNLVRAARGGSREITLRIKTRFIVRGHYRNQAHGPRRSERTMKWISPFWKGPEEGARLIHTYKLDQPPEVE
jgi:hypothetical protein